MNIECFSCAGGMAEGFKRAGVAFDVAFDFMADHCASYGANIGHKPVCMDVRDLLRLGRLGLLRATLGHRIDLFVADPPCTPWSRAGLRKGTTDERDMIEDTCDLIAMLKPRAYLIGNVPGLDDSNNWHVVQRVIGGLQRHGYCVADFAALDACDYGTPQHRIRPFWFGHLDGPCIRWPQPTHCDPRKLTTMTLPGFAELKAHVTCRQALGHLPPKELGRPVRLRKRNQNSLQHGSVNDKPARVVGTSNLSDGNVLLNDKHPPMALDKPASTIGTKDYGSGSTLLSSRDKTPFEGGYTPSGWDKPAKAVVRNTHGDGSVLLLGDEEMGDSDEHSATALLTYDPHHPPSDIDKPANTVRAGDGQGANRAMRTGETVTESTKHPVSYLDEPAVTVRGSDGGGSKRVLTGKRRKRDEGRLGQGNRVGKSDQPAATVVSKPSRVGAGESAVIEWPWDQPSTVVAADERIAPPGHHDDSWDGGTRSVEGAVVLSEKAAAILQGFPESWVFVGNTKKKRWNQIGQAMPPPLAHAVATAYADWRVRADAEGVLGPPREIERDLPTIALASGKSDVL